MAIGQPDPADVGPLSARVLRYTDLIEQTVKAAKEPGFDASAWDVLSEVVAVDSFRRVGNFLEVMDWPGYTDMLTQWATTTDFWSRFRRISEAGNCVFLELEEHNTPAGQAETVVRSLSLYEFDEAGKIRHLDIYLQYRPEGMAAQWGDVAFEDAAA